MSPQVEPETTGRAAAVQRQLRRARRFTAEASPSELATLVVGGGSLAAAFVGFLTLASWTVIPLLAFAAAALYGWVRHQGLTAKSLSLAMTLSAVAAQACLLPSRTLGTMAGDAIARRLDSRRCRTR